MTTQVTLFGPDYSTFTRTARMALEEKGVDYTLQPVDVFQGEHQGATHLARHPFAKVPSLNHDGNEVYETSAIIRYIDDAFDGQSLEPNDPRNAARMNQIIGIIDCYGYGPSIGRAFTQRAVVPMLGGEPDEAVISEAVDDAHKVFTAIEKLANAEGFLVDQKVTLADLYLIPVYDYVTQIPESEQILEGCDKLAGWWSRIEDRACVKTTRPQLG